MRGGNWWTQQVARWGLWGRLSSLAFVLLVSYAVSVPVAWYSGRSFGVMTAGVALAFCLLGGSLALLVSEFFRGSGRMVAEVLLGGGLRMGLPLGMFAIVYVQGGALVDAGLAYYLIVFYLVMLTFETLMLFPQGGCSADHTKTP